MEQVANPEKLRADLQGISAYVEVSFYFDIINYLIFLYPLWNSTQLLFGVLTVTGGISLILASAPCGWAHSPGNGNDWWCCGGL